jgi:hypothetical protein
MTSHKLSRKRLGQALGLLALCLVLLVGSAEYGRGQNGGTQVWTSFSVGAQTDANGALRAEILPNVELRSVFVVDCSNPDPLKHTLLAGAQLVISTFGLPGQLLTAATITAIQVIAVEKPLFAQLVPADFTTSTGGSTTVIEPKLKTSGGQTKICTGPVQLGAAEDHTWTIDGPSKVPGTTDKYKFTARATPTAPPGALPAVVQYKWVIVWSNGETTPAGASCNNETQPGAGNGIAAGNGGSTGNPVNVQRPAGAPAGGTATLCIGAKNNEGKWVVVATTTFTQ